MRSSRPPRYRADLIPTDRRKDPAARAEFLAAADIAILCLPDDAAKESVALVGDGATRIINTSTAHRTADSWVYGFAEIDRAQAAAIAKAKNIADPAAGRRDRSRRCAH